ncbi:unnamed protein product, partial [Larinioides sclopetarius]
MMTNCTKSKNATQDGYFDTSYPRVFEGEAYMDPIRLRRLHRLEQNKKIREGKFTFSNPPKKPYPNVTIGKTPPYFLDEEYEELKNEKHSPKRPEPRPFEPYRAGLYQQEYFDPNPYRNDEELPPQDDKEEKEEDEEKKPTFLPTNPAKK